MEIHKPKPAHSWREFAIEIATIITGILLALGAEQAVEAHHWNKLVAEGRQALKQEVVTQAGNFTYRIVVHPCVELRLSEMEAILADLDAGRRVAPVADFGRAAGFPNEDNVWRALSASGVLTHLPPQELVAFSALYSRSADMTTWSLMGGQDWSMIKLAVGDPNRLTSADRSQIRVAINHVRALEGAWTSAGQIQIDRARKLGVQIAPPPDLSAAAECQPLKRG